MTDSPVTKTAETVLAVAQVLREAGDSAYLPDVERALREAGLLVSDAPSEEQMSKSKYISPALPGMIRSLWKSDPSEASVRTALKLAGDLIQELIDIRAAGVTHLTMRQAENAAVARSIRLWTRQVRSELESTREASINLGEQYLAGIDSALRQAEEHAAKLENDLYGSAPAPVDREKLAEVEAELAEWVDGKRSWCDQHHGKPDEIELTARADEATVRLLMAKRDALAGVGSPVPVQVDEPEFTHDEGTMQKVWDALSRAGLDEKAMLGAVGDMQNAGIFFRERADGPNSEDTQIGGAQ